MNITLPPDLEAFVHDKVKSGEFSTPADALAEGVRLLQERDKLRQEVLVGLEQADRGEFVEFTAEDIMAEGRHALEARKKAV